MATLYDVAPVRELDRRPPRPANLAGEVQALHALARHLFGPFPALLEELAQIALDLCGADSAGLQLLDASGHGAALFGRAAVRGLLADDAQRVTSSDPPGPCHICLSQRAPRLFLHPARDFPRFRGIEPPVTELLTVPLTAGERMLGVLWIASHAASRLFDREDVRLLDSLCQAVAPAILARSADSVAAPTEEPESQRMRLALTAGKLGTWEADLIGGYSYWDADLLRLHGLPPDYRQLSIAETEALVHPEDRERVAAEFAAALDGGHPFTAEFRIAPDLRQDAGERWVACYGEIVRAPDGTPVRVIGVTQDISERKRLIERERQTREDIEHAAADLARAHALLDTLFAKAPVGLAFWDRDLRFVRVNDRLAEINGLPVEAHLGKTPAELFPGIIDIGRIMARWRRILAAGEPWLDVEIKGETPALPGQIRYWNENFFPVRVGDEIVGIGAVVEDITRKKQAEVEIQQLNENLAKRVGELQALLDVAPISLGIAEDPACRRITMNATFARLVGMPRDINASLSAPPEERPPWRAVHEGREMPAEELPMQQAAATGQPVSGRDIELVFADGRRLKLLSYAAPLFDARGRVRGSIGAFLDVTEQRRLEAELQQRTARLQAIDRRKDEFLATLAHELRNPLAPIRNAVHILQRQTKGDPTLGWACEVIGRQMKHLVHLVDDLLDVSRITRGKIVLNKEPVPLALLIEQAREASLPLIESREQTLDIGAPPPEVTLNGDKVRLVQILTNLLNNAAKYSDEGARIWLFAEIQSAEVAVHVKDEGMGMGPELLPLVFDLFAQGERGLDRAQGGLGIGLSLVRSLVEMHGGRVAAFSEGEGRGSEFVVWLPVWPPPRPSPAPQGRE